MELSPNLYPTFAYLCYRNADVSVAKTIKKCKEKDGDIKAIIGSLVKSVRINTKNPRIELIFGQRAITTKMLEYDKNTTVRTTLKNSGVILKEHDEGRDCACREMNFIVTPDIHQHALSRSCDICYGEFHDPLDFYENSDLYGLINLGFAYIGDALSDGVSRERRKRLKFGRIGNGK